jgi:3-isopropylmalate/(R)-2-methylmalate dehydratase small subunit
MKFRGKVWKFGHDIDTDRIIPARYLNTSDPGELVKHLMEDEDPAGKNFGCGSSREHAPIAIKASGVACVVAKSFARIFYRNSFNTGLPILECAEAVDSALSGDTLEVDTVRGEIRNVTRKKLFNARPIPPFMSELIRAGGLMAWIMKKKVKKVKKVKKAKKAPGAGKR